MSRKPALGVVALACALLATIDASAQSRPDTARLVVTVVDPSGAVIPNAKVTVTGQEDTTAKVQIAPVSTAATGAAAGSIGSATSAAACRQ